MPILQKIVQVGRLIVPRGWAPVIRSLTRMFPSLNRYTARMKTGDALILDLAQPMCLGYFFDGGVPHNQGLDRIMAQVLVPGSVFVDVGANIGYYTKLARKLVGYQGLVHAFEPLPDALPLLFANALGRTCNLNLESKCLFVGHNGSENVTVHTLAVGARPGQLDFYVQPAGDTSSLAPSPIARVVRVNVTTLDFTLRDLQRLDLLKVDVEGFELEVFQGAIETLRRHQPVIEFEFLDGYSKARGLTLDDYKAILEPLGYSFFWSNHSSSGGIVVTGPRSSDVVAVPPKWISRLGLR